METDYFRDYIEMNIELRRQAKEKTEKDMIKMTSNAIFGKTLQGIDGRVEAKFVGNREEALKLIVSPRFRNVTILNPNLSIVFMAPKTLVHDQIIRAGMVILDEAKLLYQNSYMNELIPALSGRGMTANLVYMDTDSGLIRVVDRENRYYEALRDACDILDYSNLAEDCSLLKRYPELIGVN